MSDNRKINIVYNYETDETRIILTKPFLFLPRIHRLDALQDAIYMLSNVYDQECEDFVDPLKFDEDENKKYEDVKSITYK